MPKTGPSIRMAAPTGLPEPSRTPARSRRPVIVAPFDPAPT
ncbi:hypothetical protein BQ8420_31515 [Nocardiopsis sp. JB363]|nr:hypothetical protein BQ8420_31515 [Nocardiopsis sp. JB363]